MCIPFLCMPEDRTFVFWMLLLYNGCFLTNGRKCFPSLSRSRGVWLVRVRYIFRTPARLECFPVSFSRIDFTLLPVRAKISTSINCLTCRKCYEFIYRQNDVEKWRMSEALIVLKKKKTGWRWEHLIPFTWSSCERVNKWIRFVWLKKLDSTGGRASDGRIGQATHRL